MQRVGVVVSGSRAVVEARQGHTRRTTESGTQPGPEYVDGHVHKRDGLAQHSDRRPLDSKLALITGPPPPPRPPSPGCLVLNRAAAWHALDQAGTQPRSGFCKFCRERKNKILKGSRIGSD